MDSQLKWDEDISECILEETVTLGLPSDTDTLVSDLSFLSTFGEELKAGWHLSKINTCVDRPWNAIFIGSGEKRIPGNVVGTTFMLENADRTEQRWMS